MLCNDGYTIERFIHGMDAEYNDIVKWDYKELVRVFGGAEPHAKQYAVHTRDELDALLRDPDFNDRKGMRFVEVYMPRDDAPKSLQMTAEAAAARNK